MVLPKFPIFHTSYQNVRHPEPPVFILWMFGKLTGMAWALGSGIVPIRLILNSNLLDPLLATKLLKGKMFTHWTASGTTDNEIDILSNICCFPSKEDGLVTTVHYLNGLSHSRDQQAFLIDDVFSFKSIQGLNSLWVSESLVFVNHINTTFCNLQSKLSKLVHIHMIFMGVSCNLFNTAVFHFNLERRPESTTWNNYVHFIEWSMVW